MHYLAVFVIALIVGQVGNVITNRNASRVEFERLLDGAKQYMRNHNIPAEMQKRVQRWYDYSWSRLEFYIMDQSKIYYYRKKIITEAE